MITLRDLQYRKRQFAIAIVGTGLVFALALLLTGVNAGFHTEAEDAVAATGASGWIVEKGAGGPFTSLSTMPAATAEEMRRTKESVRPSPS